MSRAWKRQRARLFAAEPPGAPASGPTSRCADRKSETVGRDFARLRSRGRGASRRWLVLTACALAAALLVASLRVSILRLRYRLAAAVGEETELLERQRVVTVELRGLRDPTRLRELATEQGFAPPERVIQLSVPASVIGSSAP